MKAVWSHWSEPFETRPGGGWPTVTHYLLACVLSFHTARSHYEATSLFTDSGGADLLIDGIGLEYDEVSTQLDGLARYDADWWTLGKLHTYRMQDQPFVHIDHDVFLWDALPERLMHVPVLAQNPKYFSERSDYYFLNDFSIIHHEPYGWLPKEWQWCRLLYGDYQKSVNTGIYGGQDLAFIRYAATLAFELLDHPGNRCFLGRMPDKGRHAGLIEMYLPAARLDYHHGRRHSPYREVDSDFLFQSAWDAYIKGSTTGYSHIIGKSKLKPGIFRRLEARVQRDYPAHYQRCVEYGWTRAA